MSKYRHEQYIHVLFINAQLSSYAQLCAQIPGDAEWISLSHGIVLCDVCLKILVLIVV